jgi:hypothetical protein
MENKHLNPGILESSNPIEQLNGRRTIISNIEFLNTASDGKINSYNFDSLTLFNNTNSMKDIPYISNILILLCS